MSATPLQVLTRPFAIEPFTRVMLPDGIFDNAIYHLLIAAHVTNTSSVDLTNVTVYLESVGDPGVVPVAHTYHFARIPAGAAVLVQWDADFEHATPGKRWVSVVTNATGFDSRRSLQQIFISQTRFDPVANTYTCTVEEGTLTVPWMRVIRPIAEWQVHEGPDGKPVRECVCPPGGPYVPTGVTTVWIPNPPYAGIRGDLPFSDPLWKVVFLIIAIVAALVAIIAAALGAGTASFGAGGTFEETDPSVSCCTPAEGPSTEWTVAGVASVIATLAAAAALSDGADPMLRGQDATPPAAGELTISERVDATWSLPQPPNAGEAFSADVEWTYTRETTGATYQHEVAETVTNVHLSDGTQIETPPKVHPWKPLWVRAKFHKPDGTFYTGPQLYTICVFRSPGGLFFVRMLTDDGLGYDQAAGDGSYAGYLELEDAYKILLKHGQDVYGTWRVYVYAQDVNLTQPGTPPLVSAQTIGGLMVASSLTLTFDPSLPCPLDATASIEVV